MRVGLLTDLAETVEPNAWTSEAALAFEIAEAMAESARDVGGFSLDLFARRDSWRGVPLVTLDLDELPRSLDGAVDRFARQEAAYCELILAGMLREYQLIHCLAPIVTPLQLLSSLGIPIVQTLLVGSEHPAANLPPTLLRGKGFRRTSLQNADAGKDNVRVIPLSVDLEKFQPPETEEGNYVLWLGTGGTKGKRAAAEIAQRLGRPLRTTAKKEPATVLREATLLLHLVDKRSPADSVWPLRALACGKPVAGWSGGDLDVLLSQPGLGAQAPTGDCELLVNRIQELPPFPVASQLRRQMVVARHGRRAMTARYREVYSSLLEG